MRILFIGIICLGLSGCTFLNAWVIKGDVKDVKGQYQIVTTGEAGRGDIIFGRTLLITTQKINKDFVDSLPNVKVTVDNDNKTKAALIGKD